MSSGSKRAVIPFSSETTARYGKYEEPRIRNRRGGRCSRRADVEDAGGWGGILPVRSGRRNLLWGHDEDLPFEHLPPGLLSGLTNLYGNVFGEEQAIPEAGSFPIVTPRPSVVDRMTNKLFGCKADTLGLTPVVLFGNAVRFET